MSSKSRIFYQDNKGMLATIKYFISVISLLHGDEL